MDNKEAIEAIEAGKHFQIQNWNREKHKALSYALEFHDSDLKFAVDESNRLIAVHQLQTCFSFYKQNPQLWTA